MHAGIEFQRRAIVRDSRIDDAFMFISVPAMAIGAGILGRKHRMERNVLGVEPDRLRKIGNSLVIEALARIGETAQVVGTGVGGREGNFPGIRWPLI